MDGYCAPTRLNILSLAYFFTSVSFWTEVHLFMVRSVFTRLAKVDVRRSSSHLLFENDFVPANTLYFAHFVFSLPKIKGVTNHFRTR